MPVIKLPQSKSTKDGSLLRQDLDSSHVRTQTPAQLAAERKKGIYRTPYGSKPKMGRRDAYSE
jgi:hypothetical protein